MTRPIDADAAIDAFDNQTWKRLNIPICKEIRNAAKETIRRLPTIDAVPVVRCRDCIYHKEKRCTVWRERAVIVECYTDDDGYCYKGLRKEHETD